MAKKQSKGEVVMTFIRGFEPKGTIMKDNHQVIPIYNAKEQAKRVKAYIKVKRSKEHESVQRLYPSKEVPPNLRKEI